jgi:hypothetical protein
MDDLIKRYESHEMGRDLRLCPHFPVVYQADMTQSVSYDGNYFENYVKLVGSPIANRLNDARTALTKKYCRTLVDIGIGSGEFIQRSTLKVYGFDINPVAKKWLEERGLWCNPYEGDKLEEIDGVTFWDALEHIPNPTLLLNRIREGQYAFVSLPIFREDFTDLLKSKHFKPNEHYYYWTERGLKTYMQEQGFEFLEWNDDEVRAGREGITTFVFRKKQAVSIRRAA